MTPRAVLWLAVVLAEGGAFVLAVRWGLSVDPRLSSTIPARTARFVNRSPVVALLAAAVVIDLAVGLHDPPSSWGLSALAAAGPRPRTGLARVAYHLADALVMAWPGLLAATCGRVFGATKATCPRSLPGTDSRLSRASCAPWPARGRCERSTARSITDLLAGCYLGAVVGLAALYPLGRVRTQALLLAWEAVALAFCAGAIFLGWRRVVAGGAPWTRAHGVLLVLVPVEAAVAAIGPFARPDVFSAWDVARWQYLLGFVVVAGLLAWPSRRRYAPGTAQPAQVRPRG